MKTPKNFNENLKQGIITKRMLGMALYSVNKRAKNYRDTQEYYQQRRNYFRSFGEYYYDKYHTESTAKMKKEQFYRKKDKLLSLLSPSCIHALQHNDSNVTEYFLYYEIGDYSFHSPISKEKAISCADLEIITLECLTTYGKDIHELLSCQFVDKMLAVIKSGDYTLLD